MSRISRDEALRRLRALIEAEDLGPGARLPAERRLAPRLGCSRETLRLSIWTSLSGKRPIRTKVPSTS